MRIGVTGANGFVGQALCRHLRQTGLSPLAVTRRPLNFPDVPNKIVSTLTDEHTLTNALRGCQALVHLAARTHCSDAHSTSALAIYRKSNVDTSLAVARAAARAGVKRIIFLSSIKAIGERTQNQPFSVDTPLQPEDAYGISKLEAEEALQELSKPLNFELTIIRSPLIYGTEDSSPHAKGNLAQLRNFISCGLPLPFASIRNKRDLISLPNLCSLITTCISHPNASGQVFLAADGTARSTPEIVQLVATGNRRKPRLVPCPTAALSLAGKLLGQEALFCRLLQDLEVDISHTCEILNWQPLPSPLPVS